MKPNALLEQPLIGPALKPATGTPGTPDATLGRDIIQIISVHLAANRGFEEKKSMVE